jgi:phosphohistidine phosphatase SixA
MGTVQLIRHAKAASREGWEGPDRDRPLTRAGWRQAAGLATLLSGQQLTRILTSPYRRCRQTVEALAATRGLLLEDVEILGEGGSVPGVFDLISRVGDAALCTHGDVVQGLIDHLLGERVPVQGGLHWQKGSVWQLTVVDGRVAAARYLPPPS